MKLATNLVPKVRAICAEYDIEIVPGNVYPMPGQTRAVATMCQILAMNRPPQSTTIN